MSDAEERPSEARHAAPKLPPDGQWRIMRRHYPANPLHPPATYVDGVLQGPPTSTFSRVLTDEERAALREYYDKTWGNPA